MRSAGYEEMEWLRCRRAVGVERLDQYVRSAGGPHSDSTGGGLLKRRSVLDGCQRGRVHASADVVGELDGVLVGASRMRHGLSGADCVATTGIDGRAVSRASGACSASLALEGGAGAAGDVSEGD